MNRANPRPAKRKGEFLSRVRPIHTEIVEIPGFSGPRPLLSFILKILAGKDRKTIRKHLMFHLYFDFQFRTPEMDAASRIMQDSPESLDNAIDAMITTMRELADLWIDSGKSPVDPDVDTPADRNTEDVLRGRPISLFRLMSVHFDRFPRHMGMRRDGTQGPITRGEPHFESTDLTGPMLDIKCACEALGRPNYPDSGLLYALTSALKAFGSRWAMHRFAELLDSQYSRHISRCDKCRAYFAYERARLCTVKFGVFCPKCKPQGAVKRTDRSRKRRLDTAARAWIEWESRQRRTDKDQYDWVSQQVSKVHEKAFGRRWVSQHLTEIQERVEALRNAKG